ncbi:MAG: DUF1638 domain-containing protein, partial [Treponema sp.]|nr:DUF1638 domain-containing protein [Treponema sp.]
KELDSTKRQKTILLYGSMCHPELSSITKAYNVIIPHGKNCIELILSPEKKAEIDKTGNIFYLTCGWLRYWREIFQHGMDTIICDKVIMLDSESDLITDEEILELSDHINIPIESEKISLEHFKETLMSLMEICKNHHRMVN